MWWCVWCHKRLTWDVTSVSVATAAASWCCHSAIEQVSEQTELLMPTLTVCLSFVLLTRFSSVDDSACWLNNVWMLYLLWFSFVFCYYCSLVLACLRHCLKKHAPGNISFPDFWWIIWKLLCAKYCGRLMSFHVCNVVSNCLKWAVHNNLGLHSMRVLFINSNKYLLILLHDVWPYFCIFWYDMNIDISVKLLIRCYLWLFLLI